MEKPVNSEVSVSKIVVKKENLNDDIKEFAQNAMNELLGWYGYDNPKEDLRIPRTCRSLSGSNSSGFSPKSSDGCGWCGKAIDETIALSSGSTVFCSELCFSQSRRANFKKNKTCDWCRHVKHTVSYVDFQDGASQLQFCSDKCLNQYKMHLFCRETRAHLELHPHLRIDESSSGTLITPDLWLKNCKSPELRSPSPDISPKPPEKPNSQISPLSLVSSPHPMKSAAPDSKRNRIKNQKKTRKRMPATVTCNNSNDAVKMAFPVDDAPQDLRVRHTPPDFQPRLPEFYDKVPVFKPIKLPTEPRVPSPRAPSPKPEIETEPAPTNSSTVLKKLFESLLPPPTVIVPYPIILPIPIPIPIPIPLPIKKEEKLIELVKKDAANQTDVNEIETENENDNENHKTVNGVLDLNGKDDFKVLDRPLRKRKRTCEPKGRVIIKDRKVILSTN
ncbi:unnamed protein product [Phyllotreta striolata]|uniref:TRASH domain-containing protein n=1 Tax=Phyllotreta striolata TaxID=444603 RepID=A0A9N9XRI0_PHYSR|nr:unnamed protein product [Phyllotreta striolata]